MLRRAFLSTLPLGIAARANGMAARKTVFFRVRGHSGLYIAPDTRLGRMNTDGSGFEVLDFRRPGETGFGVGSFFRDGRRVILTSFETNPDWKADPFRQYKQSHSHVWIWDTVTGSLTEILTRERLAPFYTPGPLLPGEDRIAVSVLREKEQLYVMNLDGSGQVPITKPTEYTYGTSLSPDGRQFAFHSDYQIYTAGIDGSNRRKVAGGEKGLLYFSTSWSPDGEWIVYVVCDTRSDPGHDWCDVWIGRPNGSETRALTNGAAALMSAVHGAKGNGAGGSNIPRWSPTGSGILYSRRMPDSKLPWEHDPNPRRDDHFNRQFKPELARGGTAIVLLDPKTGHEQPLTRPTAAQWDFRGEWSCDGRQILFCRAATGSNAALWIMDRDGRRARQLTAGEQGRGVDHPRWSGC